ncbi:MAG TPA: hypothetical protein VHK27_12685 [Gammaproteobacteria bacterium]|nr:hypothetical protein [Gammaproteobacteria bacterium]
MEIEECPYENGGNHIGYCNSCGEEGILAIECCDDGEMIPPDDCTCEDV